MFGLRMNLGLKCACCGAFQTDASRSDRLQAVALLGAAITPDLCPVCWSDVPEPHSKQYKARWEKFAREKGLLPQESSGS